MLEERYTNFLKPHVQQLGVGRGLHIIATATYVYMNDSYASISASLCLVIESVNQVGPRGYLHHKETVA
jgi:hypothetical protein